MRPSVRTITEATSASSVAELFADEDIGSAVVVDPETAALVGIVTESDILEQVAMGTDVRTTPVGSFMTASVITVHSSESIHTAANLMKVESIRRLPAVDDGSPPSTTATSSGS